MKAMIASDMLIAKKYFLQQILICLAVAIFVSIMTSNIYVGVPVASVMLPFSLAFTLLALDERDNWQQFRLALPLSRTHVIFGRYVSLVILAAVGLSLGLMVLGLLFLVATLLPSVPQLTNITSAFSWQFTGLISAISIAIILFMFTITLPLTSRFGMTKAVRFIPLVVVFGIMFAFTFGENSNLPEFATNLATWVQTPAGAVGMMGIILGVSFGLYALSAALSAALYAKREF